MNPFISLLYVTHKALRALHVSHLPDKQQVLRE